MIVKNIPSMGFDEFISKYKDDPVFTGEYYANMLEKAGINVKTSASGTETEMEKQQRSIAKDIKDNNLLKGLSDLRSTLTQFKLDARVFPQTDTKGTLIGYDIVVYNPLEESKVFDDKGGYIDREGDVSARESFDVALSDTVRYGHSKDNEFADVVNVANNEILRLKTGEAAIRTANEEIRRKLSGKSTTETRTNVQLAESGFASAKRIMKQPTSRTPTDMQDRDKETNRIGSQSVDSTKADQVSMSSLLNSLHWAYGVEEQYFQKVMEVLSLVTMAKDDKTALKVYEQREKELREGFDEKMAERHGKKFEDLKDAFFKARAKGIKYTYSGNNEDAFKHTKASIGERNDVAGDVLLSSNKREQFRPAGQNIPQSKEKLKAMYVRGIFASKMGEAKEVKYASDVADKSKGNRIAFDAAVRGIELSDAELARQGVSHLSVRDGQSVISEDLADVIGTSHIAKKETFSKEDIEEKRKRYKEKYDKYKKRINKKGELKDDEKKDFDDLSQIFDEKAKAEVSFETLLARMYRDRLKSHSEEIFKTDENSSNRSNVNIFDEGNGSYTVSGEARIPFEGGRKGVDSFQHLRTAMTMGTQDDFNQIQAYSNGKAAGSLASLNIQVITGREQKDARNYGTVLEGDLADTLIDARENKKLSDFFQRLEDDSSQNVKEGDEEGRMRKQAAEFFKGILTPDYANGKVYITDYGKDITDFLEGKTKKEISYVLDYLDTVRDSLGGNAGLGKVYGIDKDGNLYRTENSKIFYTNLAGDANEPYGDLTDKGGADLYTGHDSLVRALSMSVASMTEREKEKILGKTSKNKSIYDISKEISASIDIPDKTKKELDDLKKSNEESYNLMRGTLTKSTDVRTLDRSKYVTIGKGKDFSIDVDQLEPEHYSKVDPNKITNEEKTLTYQADQERKRLAKEANNKRAEKIVALEKELDDLEKKGDQKKIEDKQQEIDAIKKQGEASAKDFQVVIDLQGNTFGQSKSYNSGKNSRGFGGRAIFLDRDNGSFKGYSERGYHSELNRIVDPLKSGESKKIIRAANELVPLMANSAKNKDGPDYRKLTKNKMPHSFSGSSTGVNVANIMSEEEYEEEMAKPLAQRDNLKLLRSDIASVGVEISKDAARAFFEGKSADGSEVGDGKKKKRKDLWSTSDLKKKLKKFGIKYTKEIKDMNRTEVLDHLYDVLTEGSEDWERAYKSGKLTKGIEGLLGRFPFMNGQDIDPTTKIFIGKDLQGRQIRMGAGLSKKENGDFDGDHEAGKLVKLNSKQEAVFAKTAKDRENVTRRLAWISKAEHERKDADRKVFSDDFDKGATEELISRTAEIAARKNKASVGVLSNYATQTRNMMKDLGFDETLMLGTEEGNENAATAILIRTYFEAMEQDLISSKKVINQLVKNRNKSMKEMRQEVLESLVKNENLSVEELTKKYGKEGLEKKIEETLEQGLLNEQKQVLDGVQNLIKEFRDGEISFDKLEQRLIDMGVLDKEGGLTNRVTQQALLEIEYNIKGGKNILNKLFKGKYRQFGLYGKAKQQDADFAQTFEGEGKGGYEAWSKTKQAQDLFNKVHRKAKIKLEDYDKKNLYDMLISGEFGLEDYGHMGRDEYNTVLTKGAVYARDHGEKTQDGTVDAFLRSAAYKTHSPEKKNYENPAFYDSLSQEEVAAIEEGEKGIRAATGKFSEAIAKLKSAGNETANALAVVLEALQDFAGGASGVAGVLGRGNKPMTSAQGAEVLANTHFFAPYSTTRITGSMFPYQKRPGARSYDPQAVQNVLGNKDKKFLGYGSEKEMRKFLGDGVIAGSSLRGNLYTDKTQFFTQMQDIARAKGWKWETNNDLEALFESNKEALAEEKDSNAQVRDLFARKEKYDREYTDYFDFLKAIHGENGYNDEKFFLGKNRVERYEDLMPGWEEQLAELNEFYSEENRAKIDGKTVDMIPEAGFLGVTGRSGDTSYVGRTDLAALRNVPTTLADGSTKIYKSLDLTDIKTKMGKALNAGDILQGLMNSYAARQDIAYAKKVRNEHKEDKDKGFSAWMETDAVKALKQKLDKDGEKNVDWEKYYNQLLEADTARSMVLKTVFNPKTNKNETVWYSLDKAFEDIGHTEMMDQVDKYMHGQLPHDQMIQYLESLVVQLADKVGLNVVSHSDEQKDERKYADDSTTQEDVAKDYLEFMKQKNALVERKKTVKYLLKDTSAKRTDKEKADLEKEADDIEEKLKQIDENIRIAKETNADLSTYEEDGKKIEVNKEIRADKRQQKATHDAAVRSARQEAQTKLESTLMELEKIQERIQERKVRSDAVGLRGLSHQQKLANLALNEKDQSEYDAIAAGLKGIDWERSVGGADELGKILGKVTQQASAADQNLSALGADLNPTIWEQMTSSVKGWFSQLLRGQLVWKVMGMIQRAIGTIIEDAKKLDAVLVDLQIVTGDTRKNTRNLISTYASLAQALSSTTSEVASAANDWLRQGYSVSESIDLITASLQLSKLGMIDSGKATSYLTSMLKGFKLEASDATTIVDKLTKVDMSAATSAGDIAESLRQFATTAQLSGMDLDESIAMATTIMDVSQKDASSTGNAIKTMLSRFGNVKAGTYSGMNITGDQNETTESLNDIEKVLKKLGVSLRSSNLEFREFDDVLDDIAAKWDTLDSVSKNAIATAMAGTRQRESFLVLMENYDKYKDFIEEAANSEGTAAEKYKAYEDSLEASQKRLSSAFEELASKTEVVDFFKTINSLAAEIIKWLPTITRYLVALTSGKVFNGILKWVSASYSFDFSLKGLKKGAASLISGGYISQRLGLEEIGKSTVGRPGLIDSSIRRGTGPILQELQKITKNTAVRSDARPIGQRGKAGVNSALSSSKASDTSTKEGASLDDTLKDPSLSLKQKRKAVKDFYGSKLDENKKQIKLLKQKSDKAEDNKAQQKELKKERAELKQERRRILADAERQSFIASHTAEPQLADGTKLSDMKPHTGTKNFGKNKGEKYTYYTAKGHKGHISEKDYEALVQQKADDKKRAEEEYEKAKKKDKVSKVGGSIASGAMAFVTTDTTNSHYNQFTGKFEESETNDTGAKIAMKSTSALLTGLGTYFLGPLGGMLGQLLASLFNKYVMGLFFPALRKENANRDRRNKAEDTKKRVEEASSYISAVTELANKVDLTSDDYKKLLEAQREMRDFFLKPENSGIKEDFERYVQKILKNQEAGNGFAEKSFTQLTQLTDMTASDRQKTAYAMELAQLKQENTTSLNDYETTLYDYYDSRDKAWSDIRSLIYRNRDNAKEIAAVVGEDYDALYNDFRHKYLEDNSVEADQVDDSAKIAANETIYRAFKEKIGSKEIDKWLAENDSLSADVRSKLKMVSKYLQNIADTQEAIHKTVEKQRISEGIYEMSVGKNADGSEKTLLDMSPAALQNMGLDEIVYRIAEYLEKTFGGMLDGTSYFYTDENGKSRVKSTARKDIISGLKSSNEDLYNVVMGKNYTLSDVFGMKDGETKTQMLSNFANALSVTVDQLQFVADKFGDLTLGDVSLSAEDLLSKLQSMETVLGNIASGTQTWATTLQTITKNYPELIGYATDEYTVSLAMFQKMDSFKQLMTNAQFEDIISNETYFKEFSKRLTGNLTEKEKKEFDDLKLTTVKDVMTYVSNNDTDLSKKVGGLLRKEMENIKLSSEIQMQLAEKLVAIRSAQLDKEIDNLTSQKEALQDINSQREYENKLIEAKLKLEEAAKEKKRVWREGVGWVYEEDQAAISEAKDNLESVSNEKTISALTQQINQLNADKENLNSILSDQEEAVQEGFLKAYGEFDGITNGSLDSFGASIQSFIRTSDENAADRFDQWMSVYDRDRTTGISDLKTAWDNLTTAKNEMNKDNLTEEQKKIKTENYNTALGKFQEQYSAGAEKGYWSEKDFQEGGNLYEEFGKSDEASKAATGRNGWEEKAYDESLYVHDADGQWKKFKYNSSENITDISNDDWNRFFDKWNGGADFYNQNIGDSRNGHRVWAKDDSGDAEGRFIYQNAQQVPTVQGFSRWMSQTYSGYSMVKLKNGSWYRLTGDSFRKIDNPVIVSENEVPEDVRAAGGKFRKGTLDISEGNKIPLLMNEEGTEAVVTPGGTITALPTHSGIVPADITSNLWNLGNYAPDLLRALQRQAMLGMNVPGTASNDNSVDNSVSINTVQMTVDAGKGFDVDSFVQQLQQVAALTRNNKH